MPHAGEIGAKGRAAEIVQRCAGEDFAQHRVHLMLPIGVDPVPDLSHLLLGRPLRHAGQHAIEAQVEDPGAEHLEFRHDVRPQVAGAVVVRHLAERVFKKSILETLTILKDAGLCAITVGVRLASL